MPAAQTDKRIVLGTNNLVVQSLTCAGLYKFEELQTTPGNRLKTQIRIAIRVKVLTAIAKRQIEINTGLHTFFRVLAMFPNAR